MQVMLFGLHRIGFADKANAIHDRWTELLAICGGSPEAEYHRCYPQGILEMLSETAYDGITAMKSRVVSPMAYDRVSGVLNEAWDVFWSDPDGFAAWEKATVEHL
jgi:hypothetical protein